MYEAVLIPTDESEGTVGAVTEGIELASRFDAVVHALYVIDERQSMTDYDMVTEKLETRGERALDAIAEEAAAADVGVEKHLRRGIPHEEILDAAEAYGVDLIVMGTHGHTGMDRVLHLGSTTERVVRHSPLPVLTAALLE